VGRPVVEVRGVGKRYAIGSAAYGTLRDSLASIARRSPRRSAKEEIWALRDVDLTVDEGEVLGIVGRNGAGKTTLLKIIARITEPTTGVARTRGRVGALLDVGTGFHPELTGRENVHLNGAILGMSRSEITRRFDEIVEFSGVQRFVDTPLKWYSSGMELRLAFAVAANLQAEIVVVDEVLAVGDAEFRRRCIGKMSELTESGRTVLFVSHDTGAVAKLCDRAIWLDGARIVAEGPTGDIVERYLDSTYRPSRRVEFADRRHGPIALRAAEVWSPGGDGRETPSRGKPLRASVTFALQDPTPGIDLTMAVIADNGTTVLSEAWSDMGRPMLPPTSRGEYQVSISIPPILAAGRYGLRVWMGTGYETFFRDQLLSFDVEPRHDDSTESASRARVAQPEVEWELEAVPVTAEAGAGSARGGGV
jgi:ABC-type polysaccharide/polyol phosphate transport system ATPase subunit